MQPESAYFGIRLLSTGLRLPAVYMNVIFVSKHMMHVLAYPLC